MIEQKDVISFFDRCAPNWDAEMIRNEPVIRTILDNAGIRAGVDVLDVDVVISDDRMYQVCGTKK